MPTLAELASKTKVTDELWLTTQHPGGQSATYPMWFVHDGERLYTLNSESASEVWDIKKDPKVEVAIGAPHSRDRLKATGEIMTDPKWVPMMVDMLQKKYGEKHKDRMARVAEAVKGGHIIIKLKPVT